MNSVAVTERIKLSWPSFYKWVSEFPRDNADYYFSYTFIALWVIYLKWFIKFLYKSKFYGLWNINYNGIGNKLYIIKAGLNSINLTF